MSVAGIAGFGLGTLALVGIGAAFGGKQLMDERGKRALSRRQQARTAVRQFIDEVQVQAARTVRDVAREQLRRQREVAGERAAACVARRAEALRLLEEERERTVAERAAQARALEAWRSRLDRVGARLASGSDR